VSGNYIEAGGRCKQVLFLRRHRCVKYRGAGYRCKYCGTPFIRLRKQERRKAGCKHF